MSSSSDDAFPFAMVYCHFSLKADKALAWKVTQRIITLLQ